MLFFFPRDVLDEILNLIESVSEGFPSYSAKKKSQKSEPDLLNDFGWVALHPNPNDWKYLYKHQKNLNLYGWNFPVQLQAWSPLAVAERSEKKFRQNSSFSKTLSSCTITCNGRLGFLFLLIFFSGKSSVDSF